MQSLSVDRRWLASYVAAQGRPPRILHIGNIANNAYNNARLLIESGFDCDVICYDYYHVMGCPEWEDGNVAADYGDQFKPDWVAAKVGGFDRPRWFAQGPVLKSIEYLIARREGDVQKATALWSVLSAHNGLTKPKDSPFGSARYLQFVAKCFRIVRYITERGAISTRIAAACDGGRIARLYHNEVIRIFFAWFFLGCALVIRIGALPFRIARRRAWWKFWSFKENTSEPNYSFDNRVARLVESFAKAFPDRVDVLTTGDCEMYRDIIIYWRKLFEHYDIVQAYSTDPILPMLADKRPYIGFEHGTLRSHTQGDDPICRLTSLAFHLADHVFITNGDCIEYAHKIGVTRFSPMPHPVDEKRISAIAGNYEALHKRLGVRYIFLCTLRHDWAIKGTDKYIRALPGLIKLLGRDFRVIMTRWGAELDQSIALAESLEVSDVIIWRAPLPRRLLIETLKSVDVLFDQLALPHFGATAPEGIACGVPVIMSYDPKSTEWLVSEAAPIQSAHGPAEIVQQILKVLDPAWLREYRDRAARWFDEQHSTRHIVQKHGAVYSRVIADNLFTQKPIKEG